MKLWLDEDLSPTLVQVANELGFEATCNREPQHARQQGPGLRAIVQDEGWVLVMKNRRRPEEGAGEPQQPPQEVVDRLAGLLPEGALEDAVKGLRPEELSGPAFGARGARTRVGGGRRWS